MVEPGRGLCRWWLGVALMLALLDGHAQTLDDVSVSAQGDDIVAQIVFNARVQFLQQSPVPPADLYRITFNLVAGDEEVVRQTAQESRRVAARGAMPELTLTYAPSPGRPVKTLTLKLSERAMANVRQGPSSRVIEIVFVGLAAPSLTSASPPAPPTAPPSPPPSSPPIAPASSDKRYAVMLQSVPATELDRLLPVPSRFERYEVFGSNLMVGGVATVEVNIGYFATPQEAEAVRREALARFPQAVVLDLATRRGDALATEPPVAKGTTAVPLEPIAAASLPAAPGPSRVPEPVPEPAPAPAPGPTQPVAAPTAVPEVEARASDLMARAREALGARKNEDAINDLNTLLLLPPNRFSQEAQELIGVAWERTGNVRRARVEYELYLRLYPDGEGAQRVGQRLASLEGISAAPADVAKTSTGEAPATERAGSRFNGNIAQYYYGGKARSQSLVNIAAGIDQSTLTKTTESAIVTNLDLGGRYSTAEAETRVVVRGTASANLASTSHVSSLLNTAYLDYRRSESGLAVRVGRQTPTAGGLLGLFDGASVTVPVGQGFKVDLMGGVPANPLLSAPSQQLLAAMVEADNILDHWGGDLYLIDQTTEGFADRRAVGAEVRYFDELLSVYSLLDYDTLFRKVNAFTLQGSFQAPWQNTVTVLVDSRKAPSLQMTNALISSGATSLKELLQMQTLEQVRETALMTTAEARQALLSVSRPLSQNWQAAVDLRYSEIGALPAVGNFDATPATGGQYGATLQVTGSNLYSSRDVNNFNLSVLSTPFFRGAQVSYNNLTGLRGNDVTLEPALRFYGQRDNQGVKLYRASPGLRASYRLSSHTSLLGEGLVEHSRTDGPVNSGTINSVFFYLGYRYELY